MEPTTGTRFIWKATPGLTCEVLGMTSAYGRDGWTRRVRYQVVDVAPGLSRESIGRASSAPLEEYRRTAATRI